MLDILRGRVRRFPGSGWCDQGFVEIQVEPVEDPTEEQLKFVQGERPYLGNLLQVRQALIAGGCFGYGPLLPEAAERATARLRDLRLPYSVQQSRIWRPLGYR